MKYLVRVFLFNVFALWFTNQLFPPFRIDGSWQSIFLAGFILSILMLIVAPLLRILFIPINIITFGLLSWLINVIVIYLLTIFVPQVDITPWMFPGLVWSGFVIPPMYINYTIALVVSSLLVTFFSNLLHTISEN